MIYKFNFTFNLRKKFILSFIFVQNFISCDVVVATTADVVTITVVVASRYISSEEEVMKKLQE